ncbi:1-deoxyxylulose-5-phosphate synthase YajO [Usitatibacter rugosus]|uniref:1-deoxyxylulose-5-phosphate synthase YajO n=1 Tax=Usitatibacter rugosus TaxID=2732067 RepID=A0A6M4GQR1_9PROT|nr:aldo/keto reductase [Usitatibacter rugosus]QJR09472.1 1-deoxyxylulose-5-phosphate synthase YajO [Usitatibacter rugosus]
MEKRQLGRSGISVSPLAFGGNVFGWTADQATSFRLLDHFVDHGFDLVDTANTYSTWVPGHQGGESETVIGNWLSQSGKRDKVVIATKVGMKMGDGSQGLKADYIAQSVEDSLRRLRTDRIDLYQAHTDDKETPLEETLEAFSKLIKAGKVRAIGASNYTGARLREALETSKRLGLPRYETLQPCYNLYDREDFEKDLLPVVKEHEVGVIPYFALARGFLTGKYRKAEDIVGRPRESGLKKFFEGDRGTRVLAALDEVSERRKMLPTEVAVAWVMSAPGITAPIASATSVAQLDEVLSAAHRKLDATDRATLDAA